MIEDDFFDFFICIESIIAEALLILFVFKGGF